MQERKLFQNLCIKKEKREIETIQRPNILDKDILQGHLSKKGGKVLNWVFYQHEHVIYIYMYVCIRINTYQRVPEIVKDIQMGLILLVCLLFVVRDYSPR